MVQLVRVAGPPGSGCRPPPLPPGPGTELLLMVQLLSVVVPEKIRPPPPPLKPPVLWLMLQLVSVLVFWKNSMPPPKPVVLPVPAELPLTVQLLIVVVPYTSTMAPP